MRGKRPLPMVLVQDHLVWGKSSSRVLKKFPNRAGWWWHVPLIPELWKQRQVEFWEFKARLVHKR